jgi:hypothetical protein
VTKQSFSLLVACLLLGQAFASETTKVIGLYGKYPIYDMKDQDLSGDLPYNVDGQTQVSAIMLAQRLRPIQSVDIGKDGINCDFLCENPQHQVIGFDPKVLALFVEQSKMTTGQLAAKARDVVAAQQERASPTPEADRIPPIKVIGHTGNYDIYDIKDPDRSDNQLPNIEPGEMLKVYSTYYRDARDYVRFLKPVNPEDIRRQKVFCKFLCRTTYGEFVGYDAAVYARYLADLASDTPQHRAEFEKRLEANVQAAKAAPVLREQALAQAKRQEADELAQLTTYRQSAIKNRPASSNPGTNSGVPIAVIRNAIASKEGAFELTTWTESNTYVLSQSGEAVHFVEYKASWYLKPEMIQYLGSKGGISFRSAQASTAGRIGLTKRGSEWYLVSK